MVVYFCVSPVQAVAVENFYDECVFQSQGAIGISNRLFEAMSPVAADRAFAKTEGKRIRDARAIIKKLQSFGNFECNKVSELDWPRIRTERLKVYYSDILGGQASSLINHFNTFQKMEINCYNSKKGTYKSVIGIKPKCPFGFKVL